MGNFLQKLGETSFKLKWWLVVMWLVVLGGLGAIVSQTGMHTSDAISIPGTQAQQTLERFNDLFPEVGAQSAKVVIAAPGGKNISDYKADIETLSNTIATVQGVTTAASPFEVPSAISEDGAIGYITVQMQGEGDDGRVSDETIQTVNQKLTDARSTTGLTIEAGGDLVKQSVGEILGIGEIAGVVVALIVLLMTLGSLVAAGMPIVTALVAVGVSMAGLFALSTTIELSNTAPVLAVMLGLAVGIDYSLFIINRYRALVYEGYGYKEAAGKAIATAGKAVLFAASTVVIALAALTVVQIPFMTVMGLAAAATVAIAAIVAVTLIPALLGVFGRGVFGRKARKYIKAAQKAGIPHTVKVDRKTIWYRWGEALLKYRKTILFGALIVIAALAWPMTQLQLGLPTDETAQAESSQRKAYDLLVKGFGAGYNAPLLVVVEGAPATSDADKVAVKAEIMKQYGDQMQQMEATAAQLPYMTPQQQQAFLAQQKAMQAELEKQVNTYAPYYQLQRIAERIAKTDGVASAQAILTTDNGTKGVIQVTPTTGPSDEETNSLVAYLRNQQNINELTKSEAITFGVTGTTALQIDINDKLAAALPLYLGVVVGLSLLILMLAFRSILIPIKATLGFLLSVFAMFGALVAVFQWGWFDISAAPGPIVSFIPIIAIGILFGLAMDYEFFLVSSIQEAYHEKKDARKAVLNGFALGSRVVVAAGLIMVAVFAGFIGNHDATIQSMGFALAIGIFVDAFIVRMIIVPIVMSYLGKAAWWLPKWLQKRLPNISIEG